PVPRPLLTPLFLLLRPSPHSTPFPYTTLFRSLRLQTIEVITGAALHLAPLDRQPDVGGALIAADQLELGADNAVHHRRIDHRVGDRKSTRLNSGSISYAVFCLKKKKQTIMQNY